MSRTLDRLEAEAMKLGARSRAALARKLLESLDSGEDRTTERLWFEEAERRERKLDEGEARTIPAREVLRRLNSEIGKKPRTG
jgi:hypothetical protein